MLIGNLTRDPEVRYTPRGTAVGDIRLAVSRKFKGSDGAMKDEVCYVTVEVWDRTAENCQEYLRKGSPLFVEGRLKYEEWEGKDGQKANRLKVVAERVQFLGGGGRGGGEGEGGEGGEGRGRGGAGRSAPARGGDERSDEAGPAPGGDDPDNIPF